MNNFLRKNIYLILFLAIIFLGAFLRFYHFGDWLHFELDQSRDAKIIDLAIKEGPDQLPLLGPKAAGSFLRLGPIFYYFNYLSALVFGNTPSGIAAIILIFNILAIPIFFLLVRRYFSNAIGLILTTLFSFSLFLIMYSRFSWNPNALPFFIPLGFYALLRAVDFEEKRKGWWLLGAAFFLAIATQLHFLAFVSLPVITIVFLIFKRPRIKLAYWLGAIAIILVMNLPVFLNEIKTGGDNFKEFVKVATGKTNKDENRTIWEKLGRDYRENSMGYFLILSSQNNDTLKMKQKLYSVVECDQSCKKEVVFGILGLVVFTGGLILLLKNLFLKTIHRKKDFLLLVTVWFGVSFALFLPLSFDISPRYWLLVSALPFIFLGFSFEHLSKLRYKKIAWIIIIIVTFCLASSSLYQTKLRLESLRDASSKAVKVSADRILKEKHRVTLEQQYMIMDYIESTYKKNGYPVYLNSEPFYRRSFLFHLDSKNIPRDDFRNVTNQSQVYREGNYFLIYPTDSNLKQEMNNYSAAYDIVNQKEFGTLTIMELLPKSGAITAERQMTEEEQAKNQTSAGVPKRYTWEEIFDSTEEGENEE